MDDSQPACRRPETAERKYSAPALQDALSRRSGKRVLLYLTDNRRSVASARRNGDVVEVRLQRCFLDSPDDVVDELALLLAGRPTDRRAIRRFVDQAPVRERPPAGTPARSAGDKRGAGAHHDIRAYASGLNAAYLGGRSTADVVWGRRNAAKSTRSIRFACYDPARNRIIMNRKLDSPGIPRYFVEFVLFHEMLHEVLGMGERADGKRDIHGGLFRMMEETYPDYDKALRFEKELCRRLHTL